jgi:hypothetical protein
MQLRSKFFVVGMVVIVGLISIGVFLANVTAGEAAVRPSSADIESMKAVIQRSYELRAIAARTFDMSEFSTVFVDDPSVPLTSEQAQLVQKTFPNSSKSGMLSYMTAFYANWRLGADRLEQLQAKAKSEGRELTAQDLQKVQGPVGPPRRTDPVYADHLRFDDFRLVANRAEVTLDDGAATQVVRLLKTGEGWRIAGFQYLKVHF